MKPVLKIRKMSCLLIALTFTAPTFSAFAQDTRRSSDGLEFTFPATAGAPTDEPVTTSNAAAADVDSTGEPTIKLPPMPPRRVNSSPGASTNPVTPPRTSGTTMRPLDKTAFPGMSCPLVDNRPHKDLLNAAHALARVVVVTPECQNNADIVKMSEEAKKLVAAGTNLQNLWQNPDTLTSDTKVLASFNGDINVMISGLNAMTAQLQQNSLLNSKCGKEMMNGSGVLVAVSDLISSFAPFALIGASMNPAMGAALPYILGFTGVGSVAKIIKGMADANTLDMDKVEHRQAVLQNVCEFSKISQRVRFLKLAQSGQLEQVTSEIQGLRAATYSLLRSQYSDRVSSIANIRTTTDQGLKNAEATLKKDTAELQSVTSQLAGQTDKHLICYAAREVIERAGAQHTFPTRAVINLQSLLSKQTQATLAQTTILRTEERLRARLKAGLNNESDKGIEECASIGKAYLDAMGRLLAGTRETVTKLNSSLERQLSRDPEYSLFRRTELAAAYEVEGLQKVANILQQLNLDNAVIDKMELDTQMSGLKRALFGTPSGIPVIRGVSPAQAWLIFVEEQHARSLHQFNSEMRSLLNDAQRVTRSGRMDFFKRDAQGNVMRDRFGQAIRLDLMNQNQMIIDDMRAAEELAQITPAIAPLQSDNQKVLCQRLETIWLGWAATMDHLAAQDFFCQNIQTFFDASTEASLVQKCVGRRDLNGRILVRSQIAEKQAQLVADGSRDKALLISKKMKELQCEMPDASILQ